MICGCVLLNPVFPIFSQRFSSRWRRRSMRRFISHCISRIIHWFKHINRSAFGFAVSADTTIPLDEISHTEVDMKNTMTGLRDDIDSELDFDEDNLRPYHMSPDKSVYTGTCIIFNNMHFAVGKYTKRTGSAQDSQRIERVFRSFGFRVEEKKDFTAGYMMDCLRRTAQHYSRRYCAFVCFFLSHGKEESIFDRDGRTIRITELVKIFVEHCPQMEGKPKLFFAQVCRNSQDGAADSTMTAGIPIFPCAKDILLGFATTSGRTAYRSDWSGSPYIDNLTRVLRERGHKDNIFDVLTVTRRLVEESVATKNREMCPSFVSTLTRPLIFTIRLADAAHGTSQAAPDEDDCPPTPNELGLVLR